MPSTHTLNSDFLREEVAHLLTVAQEALDNEETTEQPWGRLQGNTLTVIDWRSARMDLHDLADNLTGAQQRKVEALAAAIYDGALSEVAALRANA